MAIIDERTNAKGETTYRVRIRLKGHPVQTATFARKTDAKHWAQQTEAAMREGRYFKTSESRKRTVKELLDKYTSDILPTRNKDKVTVEGHLKWWKKALGVYLLSDVTPQLIADCRDKLSKQVTKTGNPPAPATVVRYLATLSVCFTYAVQDLGWLESNPVQKVRKPSLANERVRFLSNEERQALLLACKESKCPYLYPIVVIALSTGARMSEILHLQWKDIDVQKKMMRLEQTKNGEKRAVPLSEEAYKLVRALRKVRRIDSQYLFPRADGKKPIEIKKHWKRAVESAGIQDFRFHDLRHTTASYLAMDGASALDIAHILGHKQLKMVKRYAHLTEQHTATILERMNRKQFQESEEAANG